MQSDARPHFFPLSPLDVNSRNGHQWPNPGTPF